MLYIRCQQCELTENSSDGVEWPGKGKGKSRYSSSWEHHLRATGRHLPYGITQCYLSPDTSERTLPNPSLPAMEAGTQFTYPEGMEG